MTVACARLLLLLAHLCLVASASFACCVSLPCVGWSQGLVHPKPQVDFEDRISRVSDFVATASVPLDCSHLTVCVDAWATDYTTPTYENAMHAWPDQFVIVDADLTIVEENVFGHGSMDAMVLNDYGDKLHRLVGLSE